MGERTEAIIRIPLSIVYGIILYILGLIASLVWTLQFIHTIILGRRHKGFAEFYNQYISYTYKVNRYLGFATNKRPDLIDLTEIEPVDINE